MLVNLLGASVKKVISAFILAAITITSAYAMGETKAAIDPLLLKNKLASTVEEERIEAAMAIGSLGKEGSAYSTELLKLLEDDEPLGVRAAAVDALGKVKDRSTVGRLIELLDKEEELLAHTLLSLRNITHKNLGRDIESWRSWHRSIEAQREANTPGMGEGADTCASRTCHQEWKDEAKTPHLPVMQGRCDICHQPNESFSPSGHTFFDFDFPQVESMCLGCHEQARELYNSNVYYHEPFSHGLCDSCHDPHGSLEVYYLRENRKVVVEVEDERILKSRSRMCTACHSIEKFMPSGSSKTNFSDSGTNLHNTHLAVADSSGLGCVACHEKHGGPGKKLLRAEQGLSRSFELTDSGGTCTVDCHGDASYKR